MTALTWRNDGPSDVAHIPLSLSVPENMRLARERRSDGINCPHDSPEFDFDSVHLRDPLIDSRHGERRPVLERLRDQVGVGVGRLAVAADGGGGRHGRLGLYKHVNHTISMSKWTRRDQLTCLADSPSFLASSE